ncbi:MAG: ATP-binding cassette domain-containing protein [Candidatus Eisenbacteria bacterium]
MTCRLSIRELTLRPAPEAKEIRVTVEIPEGGAAVLQGASGSGKTTFLRAVARLREVEGGEIDLRGTPWRAIPPREWRRRVVFVPSKPQFREGTVEANLRFPFCLKIAKGETFPGEQARALAGRMGLDEKQLGRETRVLSDGERARVGLLRALLAKPEVLLLDEPTAPLDPESRTAVLDLLREERERTGLALLVASHDERLAESLGAAVWPLLGRDE